jgi:hypothetical protein
VTAHRSCVAVVLLLLAATPLAADNFETLRLKPEAIEERFRNPYEDEEGFLARSRHALSLLAAKGTPGNAWGENEKRTYAFALAAVLAGDKVRGLAKFQENDPEDIHRHTFGIDLYWCFTLKHQPRKYFLLRDLMAPDYVERMDRAIKVWTEEDPLRRPHPQFGAGDRSIRDGWGPQKFGSWVDVRDTDNLRLMRDVSVYLFAEASGNEATRRLYLDKLHAFVRMLYRVGQREWDSENYLMHGAGPLLALYDFAEDPQAKLLAKAGLDWIFTAAAIKYWRGGWGGPVCRDYGGANKVFGGSATHESWLYFGDHPAGNTADPDPYYDVPLFTTSAYRPPPAVVALAHRRFDRPVTLHATKPPYTFWLPPGTAPPRHHGDVPHQTPEATFDEPAYFETTYFGRTFQIGSLDARNIGDAWDVSPFKIMVEHDTRGVDHVVINTAELWGHGRTSRQDRIAHVENRVSWRRQAGAGGTFFLQVPKDAAVNLTPTKWTIALQKATIVIEPINIVVADADLKVEGKARERYPDQRFMTATPAGPGESGFNLVVFDDARTPSVPGEIAAPERSKDVYDSPMVRQAWRSGELRVEAGGWVFEGRLADDGTYTFENRKAP